MNSLAQLQSVFDNIIARIKRLETRQGPAPSYSNVLANGGFEVWNAGDSVAPDGWFLVVSAGSTLAINKSTDHSDYSNFSARVVYTQGGGAALPSFVRQTLNGPFQGYPLAVSVRIKTNVAGAVRLEMFGGGGAVGASAYHTGSGQWETLTLVVAPSILVFGIAFYASGTFALDNAMIIQGSAPVDYIASTVGVGSGVGGGDMDTDGTVTSVALSMPIEFNVSDSPITTSGTFGVTKAVEAANEVWAGPTSGGPAVPTFRALVAADIPSISDNDTHLFADNGDLGGIPGIRFRNAAQTPGTSPPLGAAIYQANNDVLYIQMAAPDYMELRDASGASLLDIVNDGNWFFFTNLLISPVTDTTTAIQFLDSLAAVILNIDTVNRRVGIGVVAPKTVLHGTGSTIVGVAATANADGDLGDGEVNLWETEVATDPKILNVKVKGSTGTVESGKVFLRDLVTTVTLEFDDGGGVLADQSKELWLGDTYNIVGITLGAPNEVGSVTVDVLKATYAAFPTLGSITAGSPGVLSAAQKAQPSIAGWTVAVGIGFVQVSISSITDLTKLVVGIDLIRVA